MSENNVVIQPLMGEVLPMGTRARRSGDGTLLGTPGCAELQIVEDQAVDFSDEVTQVDGGCWGAAVDTANETGPLLAAFLTAHQESAERRVSEQVAAVQSPSVPVELLPPPSCAVVITPELLNHAKLIAREMSDMQAVVVVTGENGETITLDPAQRPELLVELGVAIPSANFSPEDRAAAMARRSAQIR